MTLRLVSDDNTGPLAIEDANAVFQEHWAGARKAYATLLQATGGLAHPLFITIADVTYAGVRAAQRDAERITEAAQTLAAEIAACRDVWHRVKAGEDR